MKSWLKQWWCKMRYRSAMAEIDEFERKFPGKCIICSYHAYGINHGHVKPSEPVSPHDLCPEDYRRWK